MQLNNFFVEYQYHEQFEIAEIRPCCQENNVYYYDVYIGNKYEFTVTPSADENETLEWKMALKNADNPVDAQLLGLITEQIEKHFFNSAI